MPRYDLGYTHWSGDWTTRPYRWWVVTRQGIRMLAGKKRFLVLMILSSILFFVRAVMIYLSASLGSGVPILQVNAGFFESFLSQQGFFLFIISIYAGAGLIANDLKANALQIYFSKPITRRDYLIGKLGVLVFFLALPTLVPAVLLYILAILFEANPAFFTENYWVLGSIIGYSLILIFTCGLTVMGLSSIGKSSRFAGIAFAALFFFSNVLGGILKAVLRTSRLEWISLGNNFLCVGDVLFRSAPRFQHATWVSFAILAFLMGGSAWIAYKRVHAVEVVV
jgi:ABC-2 type transport system permease protein